MGLSKELDQVLHEFIIETFAKFNKLDYHHEIMDKKIEIMDTWFTELHLARVQHFQSIGLMKQGGESSSPTLQNIIARAIGQSDNGHGSHTLSEIPMALKRKTVTNEMVDAQVEGMDWLDQSRLQF